MKKKLPVPIRDGIIGFMFGLGGIIPGIAGGTILLVTGTFKKVADAAAHLFSKNFIKNFLILLPFVIGGLLAVAALIKPIGEATKFLLFPIVCLFAGLIIGTIPSITDNLKDKPFKKSYIFGIVISIIIAAFIGVLSLIFKTNELIDQMFIDVPFYLYFVLFVAGFIAASGLIIPGFSGSMFLLAICLYQPILSLFSLDNLGRNISLLAVFIIGAAFGFIIFSKTMSHFIKKHKTGTYYCALGLVIGSLIAVYANGKMIEYLKGEYFNLLDKILGPILLLVGIIFGFLFVLYIRKHPEVEENAKN